MRKFHLYSAVVGLVSVWVSGQDACAEPRGTGGEQRQILFESLLYGGGAGPDLADKYPAIPSSAAPRPAVASTPPPPAAQPRRLAQEVRYETVPTAARSADPAPVLTNIPGNDLYRRAKSGDPDAEYQMGMLHLRDQPTGAASQSFGQPYYWFTQAASKGHKRAQYNLGVMYAQGEGVIQNLVEAYIWFNLSSAQRMEGAVDARDMVATSLTPDALMKAQERSALYQQQIAQNLVRMEKGGVAAAVPIR